MTPPDAPVSLLARVGVTGGSNPANLGGFDVATSVPTTLAFGQITDRNLVPHLSEMDSTNSEVYALRVARTPVPKHLERVITRHLARIYGREIQRAGTPALESWWTDVDGCGMTIDQWVQEVFAPQFLACGQLDLLFDHPEMDDYGPPVKTRRDLKDAGLDGCVISVILPENMLWWRLDSRRRYVECLVLEWCDDKSHFRHWTPTESTVYDRSGNVVEGPIPHPFGVVPIRRLFDKRKNRSKNVGQPRYETAAEYQKAIYNGLSEQILGDVQQAHPLLQGPEDFVEGENKITVGPTNILPMKKSPGGDAYQGWEFVDPPQGAAVERRVHLLDFQDQIDGHAALTKPAGANGAGTVAQSGLSKSFDDQQGNDYLTGVATALERAEIAIARMVIMVLGDGEVAPDDEESISIVYPRQFDLATGGDLAAAHGDVVGMIQNGGDTPETTKEFAKRAVRVGLPGLPDERLDELYRELESAADQKREDAAMMAESRRSGEIEASGVAIVQQDYDSFPTKSFPS